MDKVIAQLFAARDTSHRLHLRTRSFSAHMALGDLYDALVDLADGLAEIYQGKYGVMTIPNPEFIFTDSEPVLFIRQLAQWAEQTRGMFNPADTNLLNEWDTVLSTIYRAKYKLENLH